MPPGIGYSFAPGAPEQGQGGMRAQAPAGSQPASVKFLNLRLPKQEAPNTIAPMALLQSQGSATPGLDPELIALLLETFKPVPQAPGSNMSQRINVPGHQAPSEDRQQSSSSASVRVNVPGLQGPAPQTSAPPAPYFKIGDTFGGNYGDQILPRPGDGGLYGPPAGGAYRPLDDYTPPAYEPPVQGFDFPSGTDYGYGY
jgi:hypothetical protein